MAPSNRPLQQPNARRPFARHVRRRGLVPAASGFASVLLASTVASVGAWRAAAFPATAGAPKGIDTCALRSHPRSPQGSRRLTGGGRPVPPEHSGGFDAFSFGRRPARQSYRYAHFDGSTSRNSLEARDSTSRRSRRDVSGTAAISSPEGSRANVVAGDSDFLKTRPTDPLDGLECVCAPFRPSETPLR